MKYVPSSFVSMIILLSLSSCSIDGTLQGLLSYYPKTVEESPEIFANRASDTPVCYLKNDSKIHIVNGHQISVCIQKSHEVLVYQWSPHCQSSVCRPLAFIQEACDTMNVDLFVIAAYYDAELMSLGHKTERPIFGIDTKYYKTEFTGKYKKRFLDDLSPTIEEEIGQRFLHFKDGFFVDAHDSIEDFLNHIVP